MSAQELNDVHNMNTDLGQKEQGRAQKLVPSDPGAMKPMQNPRRVFQNGHYTVFPYIIDTDNVEIAGVDHRRIYFLLQNKSVNSVFIDFSTKASIKSLEIAALSSYELIIGPRNRINAIAGVAGNPIVVILGRL